MYYILSFIPILNTPCGVTPPPPVLSTCRFEECVCLRLTVLCKMQIRALCFEETVCVPCSVLVLGGSLPLALGFCHCLAEAPQLIAMILCLVYSVEDDA